MKHPLYGRVYQAYFLFSASLSFSFLILALLSIFFMDFEKLDIFYILAIQ